MRSNGPEGGGQDARHKLPGIKQVKSPSCRMAFAFLSSGQRAGMPPGGAALAGLRIRHGATSLWPDKVRSTPPGKSLLYHRR
ncbi:hypothetical protein CKJ89_35290 [Klebsiella pneumoniae]|nr:hypothetical protein CKJ89_35290 [Klebsiella pneumoniae]